MFKRAPLSTNSGELHWVTCSFLNMSINTSTIAIIHTKQVKQPHPKNTIPTVRLEAGTSWRGTVFQCTFQIIAGRMNGKMYQDILDKYLLSSTRMMKMKAHRRGPRSIQDFKTVQNHSHQQRQQSIQQIVSVFNTFSSCHFSLLHMIYGHLLIDFFACVNWMFLY